MNLEEMTTRELESLYKDIQIELDLRREKHWMNIREKIFNALKELDGKKENATATQIGTIAGISNTQLTTCFLQDMVNKGIVVKTIKRGKIIFRLA